MRWQYTFENGIVMVFSHSLLPYEEKVLTKKYGKIISVSNYNI